MWCCLCDPTFSRFSRTPTCVRQTRTDRQTQGHSIYRASIASRGKKLTNQHLQYGSIAVFLLVKRTPVLESLSANYISALNRLESLYREIAHQHPGISRNQARRTLQDSVQSTYLLRSRTLCHTHTHTHTHTRLTALCPGLPG